MDTKDPTRVERGRAGALKRWGGQRILRLDDLTPDQRRLVLAFVEMAKAAPVSETSGTATPEGQANVRPAA